jgi:hypothetical protein
VHFVFKVVLLFSHVIAHGTPFHLLTIGSAQDDISHCFRNDCRFHKVECFLIKGVILDTPLVIIGTFSDAFSTSHMLFAASSGNLNIVQ